MSQENRVGTILVIDDDDLHRGSLKRLLTSEGYFVLDFASADEFLNGNISATHSPAALILDMKMPDKNGLYVQQKLKERGIEIPIIFLSGQSFPNEIISSFKNGAFDFLLKPFDVDELLTAISNALNFHLIQHEFHENKSQTLKDFEALTKREKEVYALINSGLPSIDIAARLDISPRTIKAHKAQIMEKMNADSPQDLLKKWITIHK